MDLSRYSKIFLKIQNKLSEGGRGGGRTGWSSPHGGRNRLGENFFFQIQIQMSVGTFLSNEITTNTNTKSS